jgi:hypothetical protein
MKKGLVNHRAMLSGILLGVSAALLTFVLAGAMVFTSGDFWLKQEEKHKHTQKLMLTWFTKQSWFHNKCKLVDTLYQESFHLQNLTQLLVFLNTNTNTWLSKMKS